MMYCTLPEIMNHSLDSSYELCTFFLVYREGTCSFIL